MRSYLPVIGACVICLLGTANALGTMLALTCVIILVLLIPREEKALRGVIVAAFVIRAIVILIDQNIELLPYRWDDYHLYAIRIKENILSGMSPFHGIHASSHVMSYSFFSSLVYLIMGNLEIAVRMLNAFFAAIVIERAFRICMISFGDKRVALVCATLVAFLPSFIIFTSLHMRDSLIFLLLADMLYRTLAFARFKRLTSLALALLEILALFFLRRQYVLLFALVFVTYFLFALSKGSGLSKRATLGLLGVFCAGLVVVVILWFGSTGQLLDYARRDMNWRTAGGSVYLKGMEYNTWFDIIKYLPLRFLYFTFGPFLWDVHNIFMFAAFLESLAILAVGYFTIRYWRQNMARPYEDYQLFLVVFGLVGLTAGAAIDSNYGTAIRHKMHYIFVFFPMAAAYLQRLRVRFLWPLGVRFARFSDT